MDSTRSPFTDSLARLTGAEQKAVKTTAFDLQLDLAAPSMRFQRLDRAKDPNFWSVRVSTDIRLIVHRTATSLLLCYVGHHDAAYSWAERRKIERYPVTVAAQLVELRERVEESTVLAPTPAAAMAIAKPALFADMPDGMLLGYGVPMEWLADVRQVNEDTLLDLADHLPQEAAKALLSYATGGIPTMAPAIAVAAASTRRRMSVLPSCGFWRRSAPAAATACSLPAISGSASFSSRSRGGRSGSKSAGARTRCEPTIGRRIRSALRLTGCCPPQ